MHRRFRTLRTRLAAAAGALTIGGALVVTGIPASQAAPADDRPAAAELQQVELAKGVEETGEPMTLAVLPDGDVLHTAREGTLWLTQSDGSGTSQAGKLDVYDHDEEGLQGVGVDPDFEQNRHIYLYYAPPLDTPEGDAPETGTAADFEPFQGYNQLSRFTLDEDGTLDASSETEILRIDTDRGQCCHVGGDIAFDSDGNLLMSTGDDSNPFQSDGFTPIDEREDRNPVFDAQRSSGNANDLRGKLLRIHVEEDGSYTIPEGNLFEEGTEGTRAEVYAMGFRNPFRISVDPATDHVYVGDYGPDAGEADPARGPGGQVEFNKVTEPGNFGWPYCTGDNDAYVDYDFATEESGESFDCSAPVNDSPHNDGIEELPAANAAWIPYDGDSVPEFGDGSESPMGGPVYRYDADLDSQVKFPEEFDGDFFAGEFGRQWIKRIEQDDSGAAGTINDFPWEGTQVMDMEFGPDGALYVLDYGTGYFGGDENSALYRIENAEGGGTPGEQLTATAEGDVTSGPAPLEVTFTGEGSDPSGEELSYAWDFGDETTGEGAEASHTYEEEGTYLAQLTVTNESGDTASANVQVTVGNTAPTVELKLPADGQLFEFGDEVPFEVTVTDPEDGEIDCEDVTVNYILGHDQHGHPLTSANGCEGTIKTSTDGGHDAAANVFGVFDAQYTDGGNGDLPPLTVHDQHTLQPKHRQAEHFSDAAEGVTKGAAEGAEGANAVTDVQDGQWISFDPYLLTDASELSARVQSEGDGTIEVRADAPDGELLGTVEVSATDGWQEVSTALENQPETSGSLYLVFGGSGYTFDSFTLTTE
ncbi:PQQ-dependent sugar dehydrogenase [Streptomyces sulphureus]|uniref:PQQ-dependent sugar dehydrogenase n=1 Tax=Streptomyces sulphureus TaxID=47758 RepID=UPI00037ADF6C